MQALPTGFGNYRIFRQRFLLGVLGRAKLCAGNFRYFR
jgi:hypothetical protein